MNKPWHVRCLTALALAAPLAFAGCATQPAANGTGNQAATHGTVSVVYEHPHKFTESKDNAFGHEFNHGDYLGKLKRYVETRAAKYLAPDEHLQVTFTNIKLAGSYEPWRGPMWSQVRFMRDVYPPRFAFTFKLTGADGQVLREGTRKLNGLGYLYDGSGGVMDTDPLRFDKALLDRWIRQGPDKW